MKYLLFGTVALTAPLFALLFSATPRSFAVNQSRTSPLKALRPVAPFLTHFPLACGRTDSRKRCTLPYDGPYTPDRMNSLMDHHLLRNGGTSRYAYQNADGIIVAFNGARLQGAHRNDKACISGDPRLFDSSGRPFMTTGICPSGSVSYDEHPGYDYRASAGMEVRAAASGTVANIGGARCWVGDTGRNDTCADWGLIGVDHGNGYITQYMHMKEITSKRAGASIRAGEVLGLTSNTAPRRTSVASHFHFEVIRRVTTGQTTNYYYVDPYGWTGSTNPSDDPLFAYSNSTTVPSKLWIR